MPTVTVTKDTLDQILALQIIVAWAGEGICEPKRLDWWRTDLIDEPEFDVRNKLQVSPDKSYGILLCWTDCQ